MATTSSPRRVDPGAAKVAGRRPSTSTRNRARSLPVSRASSSAGVGSVSPASNTLIDAANSTTCALVTISPLSDTMMPVPVDPMPPNPSTADNTVTVLGPTRSATAATSIPVPTAPGRSAPTRNSSAAASARSARCDADSTATCTAFGSAPTVALSELSATSTKTRSSVAPAANARTSATSSASGVGIRRRARPLDFSAVPPPMSESTAPALFGSRDSTATSSGAEDGCGSAAGTGPPEAPPPLIGGGSSAMVSVYQAHRLASTHARRFSPSSHRCAAAAAAVCIRARTWART